MKRIIRWDRTFPDKFAFPGIGHSFRAKVLVAFLGLALIPLAILGLIIFNAGSGTMMAQAAAGLEAARTLKAERIQSWLEERRKDILILSENPSVIDAMLELEEGFEEMGGNAERLLRSLYLGKPDVANNGDGSEYSEAHEEIHELFSEALEYYGYNELYMVTLEGDVVYSTKKTDEFGTNLKTGPYKDTNLAAAFNKAFASGDDDFVTIQDYAYFPPVKGPAAFVASPMFSEYFEKEPEMADRDDEEKEERAGSEDAHAEDDDEGEGRIVGIMIYQLPIERLNAIMQERTGLGETGETYLVGPDGQFRSESLYREDMGVEHSILSDRVQVETEAVKNALAGSSDTREIRNYLGRPVLSSWSPLVIDSPTGNNQGGVKWALISEIALTEVRAPVYRLAWLTGAIAMVSAVLIAFAAVFLSNGVTRQVRNVTDLFSEIGMGNFGARAAIVSRDELGRMAESLNAMLENTLSLIQTREDRDAMQASVMKLLEEISSLTEGDLTARAEVTEEITGAIADSFNAMASQLSQVVLDVKKASRQTSKTAKAVTANTERLAETGLLQTRQVESAIGVIQSMADSMREVADRAKQSAVVSEESKQNAEEGSSAVEKTNQAMSAIRDRVQETARAIKRLGESSQEIGNIVQIINDIADRTSILALNASIQAAMAGDAGRGFGVVAEEVQRLAERSTNSTKQIEKLVKSIQSEINEAGVSMEESIQRVVEGTQLAGNAHEKLQEIEAVSAQLAELVQFITNMTHEQVAKSEEVSKTMQNVGKVSTQTSIASRKTASAMLEMNKTAERLRESVEVFRVEEPSSVSRDAAA